MATITDRSGHDHADDHDHRCRYARLRGYVDQACDEFLQFWNLRCVCPLLMQLMALVTTRLPCTSGKKKSRPACVVVGRNLQRVVPVLVGVGKTGVLVRSVWAGELVVVAFWSGPSTPSTGAGGTWEGSQRRGVLRVERVGGGADAVCM